MPSRHNQEAEQQQNLINMSDITPGSSFSNGQQITATDLNNLVGNANIANAVIDNTHLKQTSVSDSIFNFSVIADANISDNDYFLIWSATDGAFRRVSKGTINSQNNVSVGGTTIDTSGNLILSGTLVSDQLILGADVATIPTGKTLLFTDTLSANHIKFSKDSSSPALKIFNPINDGSTSINCYGSLNAIAPMTTSDNGVLKISATDSTGAFKTWNFSSINNANQLEITSSQSGTGTVIIGGALTNSGHNFATNIIGCTQVTCSGSITGSTKNFLIDHPFVEGKKLRHTCIESNKADLIYRGVAGVGQVNLDTATGMSPGTFDSLVKNCQVFIQNNQGWDKFKGSVSGNTLTIESENSDSIDQVEWMVIGQRKDPTILGLDITDDQGEIILEEDA